MKQHPLVALIEMRRKAARCKAHPLIKARIEKQISEAAEAAVTQFRKTESQFPVLSKLKD